MLLLILPECTNKITHASLHGTTHGASVTVVAKRLGEVGKGSDYFSLLLCETSGCWLVHVIGKLKIKLHVSLVLMIGDME